MNTGRLQLLGAALLFSTGGVAIKALSLNSWQVASFRSVLAAAALYLLLPNARKGFKLSYLAPAFAYAGMLITFVSATKLTTSANAIFLQSTAPLYLVFLGPLILKERARRADWLTLVILGAGLSLFFLDGDAPLQTAPHPFAGNLVGALSGVMWAFVVVSMRWLGTRSADSQAGMKVVILGNLLAFAACLPLALPVVRSAPADWAILAYLGPVQVGLAYVLMTKGLQQVPALESSMILLAEPAINPIWTGLLLREVPAPLAILGGALILGGTLLRMAVGSRRERPAPAREAALDPDPPSNS
ncbi:MAG: EamA family transporter [Bryobacterales bacterium]|nr:EamA family transporter [Bryobacterales bacterium]